MRTIEAPFMLLFSSLLFSCGKIDVSFSLLKCSGGVESKIQAGIVNARIKNVTKKTFVTSSNSLRRCRVVLRFARKICSLGLRDATQNRFDL